MQYDMKNVFTFVVFRNTLKDVNFIEVDCPCNREEETIIKFNSPHKTLKVVKVKKII
jgi:hypothetical protein